MNVFVLGAAAGLLIDLLGTPAGANEPPKRSPEPFGRVMSMVKPRFAVACHFTNDFDVASEMLNRIRKTWDGEVSLSVDGMVWNVTKDDIRVRMSAVGDGIWPSPALEKKNAPDFTQSIPISDFTKSGARASPRTWVPSTTRSTSSTGPTTSPGSSRP